MDSRQLIQKMKGLLHLVVAILLLAFLATATLATEITDSAWDFIPERTATEDHSAILTDPFSDALEATATCLLCHADIGEAFLKTSHWTWNNSARQKPGDDTEAPFGKINSINNFCIAVDSNWVRCSQCHAGYGWRDADFDFTDARNIDCLVCHDTTGSYRKASSNAGYPEEDVDLQAVAQSVGRPSRANCGACHFYAGGGDGVKRGDMDSSLANPSENVDVHMGRHDLQCVDCHQAMDHHIQGRLPMLNEELNTYLSCASCHGETPHSVFRINAHCRSIACQTCHIPSFAPEIPTRLEWDWSTAGVEEAPDEREWEQQKGSFVSGVNVTPAYMWWNGDVQRYSLGQDIDPAGITNLNYPLGYIADPAAKIWPFKIHRGIQPYDAVEMHFLVPQLAGEGGFWQSWDWDTAFRLGAEASGVAYSGEYGFAESAAYLPLSHMVRPKEKSLSCMDCHGENGKFDWSKLGYSSDPMIGGGHPRNPKTGDD